MKRLFGISYLLSIQRPTIRVPIHLSPDGRLLAISVQDSRRDAVVSQEQKFRADGVPVEMIGSRVLIVNTASGEAQEIFPPSSTSWSAQWSPDGQMLAAYVQHGCRACLGIWDRKRESFRLLKQAPVRAFFGFEVPQWTPDGKSVVVKLLPSSGAEMCQPQSQLSEADEPSVTVLSFDPTMEEEPRQAFEDVTEKSRCNLGLVDAATGGVKTLAEDWRLSVWRISPNGQAVALFRMVDAIGKLQQLYFDLMIVPLDDSQAYAVAERIPLRYYGLSFNWSPDSREIAYTTFERGHSTRIFAVPIDGSDEPRDITGDGNIDLSHRFEGPRWGMDGRTVYCLGPGDIWEFSTDGDMRRKITTQLDQELLFWVQPPTSPILYIPHDKALPVAVRDPITKKEGIACVDIDKGQTTLLAQFAQTCSVTVFGREVTADGLDCYLITEAADHPSEIWNMHRDSSDLRRVYPLNPNLDDVALGESRLIEYLGSDGTKRQAALLLPSGHEEGKPIPLIVWVYGGALGSNLINRFGFGEHDISNAQLLASEGYAVIHPDMPMESRDPLRQLPGLVLPAVSQVIKMGIADPRRMGLMGHSYGGYCVLALLSQTTVFRAAISSAAWGINLTSFYSSRLGWCESGQAGLGGTPWDRRDAYIENSPFFYLDRVSTPLLLVCGTEDRGATAQAEEAFSALRRLGKRVELRKYNGEGHWPGTWSEHNLRDLYEHVLKWLGIYLKAL